MGCISSSELSPDEERMRQKCVWKPLDFTDMPGEEMEQLDTDQDVNGNVEEDKILVPTREVYGKPPVDMKHKVVEWDQFGVDIDVHAKRASPYDFPAFEHEKKEIEKTRQQQETNTSNPGVEGSANEKISSFEKEGGGNKGAAKRANVSVAEANKPRVKSKEPSIKAAKSVKEPQKKGSKEAPGKQPEAKKEADAKKQPEAKKEEPAAKKPKRTSQADDPDCSISTH